MVYGVENLDSYSKYVELMEKNKWTDTDFINALQRCRSDLTEKITPLKPILNVFMANGQMTTQDKAKIDLEKTITHDKNDMLIEHIMRKHANPCLPLLLITMDTNCMGSLSKLLLEHLPSRPTTTVSSSDASFHRPSVNYDSRSFGIGGTSSSTHLGQHNVPSRFPNPAEELTMDDIQRVCAVEEIQGSSKNGKAFGLVINIEEFDRSEDNRRGASEDSEMLKSVFYEMDIAKSNSTFSTKHVKEEELETYLTTFKSLVESNDVSSIFVYIGSHGDRHKHPDGTIDHVIITSDHKRIPLYKNILTIFSDEQMPGLRNVPKFIMVQACRGQWFDTLDGKKHRSEVDSPKPVPPYVDPTNYSNLVVCSATLDEFVAFRQGNGSVLILNSSEVLKDGIMSKSSIQDTSEQISRIMLNVKSFIRKTDLECLQTTNFMFLGVDRPLYLGESPKNTTETLKDELYSYSDANRGCVKILWQKGVKTQFDKENLENTCKSIGFSVDCENWGTIANLKTQIKKIQNIIQAGRITSLVFFIIPENVDEFDCAKIQKRLLQSFNNQQSASLKGIPKMFFLPSNCFRGKKIKDCQKFPQFDGPSTSKSSNPSDEPLMTDLTYSDILIVYGSNNGILNSVNSRGTLFYELFCSTINHAVKLNHQVHATEILTKVNRRFRALEEEKLLTFQKQVCSYLSVGFHNKFFLN